VRLKALLLLAIALAVGFVAILLVSHQVLEPSYARLEQRFVATNVERAVEAVQTRLDYLTSTNYDWSAWDDTYEFVQTGASDYIESNLTNDSLAAIRVHVVVFLDDAGGIVYAKAVDTGYENQVEIPEGLEAHLASGSLLLAHDGPGSVVAGVLGLPEGTLLVSARPVLPSSEEGPIEGTLLMGVHLDEVLMEELASSTRLSLSLTPTGLSVPSNESALEEPGTLSTDILVTPVTQDAIEGRTQLLDVYGQPVATLVVPQPRSINAEGQHTLRYLSGLLAILGVGFGLLLVVLVDRMVLRRIARLAREIHACGEAQDFTGRVSEAGNDEIGDLSRAINDAFEALAQTHAKLRNSHSDLEQTTADLKRTEQELRTTANQLRRLTRHLQSVREEERALVASEMHDRIGQALTTLRMDLATLTKTSARGATPPGSMLDEMARVVDSLVDTVKRMSVGLYPSILGDLGLNEAMEWQLAEFGKMKGVHTTLSVRGDPAAVDSGRALVLFRILQESLAEMAGHSAATEVNVTLNVESRYVLLSIVDNGRPLSESDTQSGRAIALGLIKDRAEVLGGGVTFTSDESGTAIVTQLPL
jgi:sensor domain CHASE-containing protein